MPKNEITVKICGLTNLEDARFCAGAGVDFLGFIQYPKSPRYVTPEVAAAIIAWVYGPEPVGVFVNEDADTVNRVAEAANFALVQLHGDEPPELCARIERPVIKAFRIPREATVDQMRRQMEPYREHAAYFLLDTHHPTLWGGTGATFDWQQARTLAAAFPILLAGGIRTENVEEAVRSVRPLGVDLSSSLEAYPGKKDLDKMTAFFDVVNAL
ncbi:MAG: phosphoribosylanthranilate isomerase [Rhodothermales bacterium]